MEINQIYTELIREHSVESDNKKTLDDKTDSKLGVNPSCGDEIVLNLKINDGIIEDGAYEGVGCAISQASTSMMIDAVKGKTIEEARDITNTFLNMIKSTEELSDLDLEKLGDAATLQNINKLPARVKCAVLAWRTLEQIIENR
ncbi:MULTISPECIES: Fe-S cluster assembly sulfur transfer protein SufU [Helcococcus]|uniref:Fe-S cluster assembly sulfur transfer protein SufU n=1 Tax=Helcococcus bovis TaxID=3153252 RepID=A0ABW9F476_9FIRM